MPSDGEGGETDAASSAFRPAWWLPGPHAQTIWANRIRRVPPLGARRLEIAAPDGDRLAWDLTPGAAGRPTVVLLHGLDGSPASPSVQVFARAAARRGYPVACAAFRTSFGEPPRRPSTHHAARIDDLDLLLAGLPEELCRHGLHLVGVSLGGSLLGLWLGTRGAAVPDEVRSAALVSAPFDLARSSRRIETVGGGLYGRNFLRGLRPIGTALAALVPDRVDEERVRAARTVRDFDDAVIAPLHGFASAEDYYSRASCGPRLETVRRPTLVLSALDDPFHPRDTVPVEVIRRSTWLEAGLTERGGHVGWLEGALPGRPRPWAPERLLRFLARH